MAQTGFTPIQLYYSTTAGASPIASSLANGELAINITDGKLFYKENTGTISVIGWKLVPTTAGGTGQTTYVNGQLLIGNSTGNTLTKATLTAGSGISVTNGTGSITLANTGVLSFDGGSTGLLPSTATTGVVSLSGTLGVGYGGTGQTTYTNGQLLIGNTTGNTLTKATLTAGSGVSISNGAGSITISATGSGGTVTAVTGTAPVVSSGGTTPAISMPKATTSVDGYLSSTDWTTFNNKGSGTVTSVTATSPVASTGGATPVISMPAATTSVSGYLTSTDWNTFNGKQPAGTYVTAVSGTAPVVSSGGTTPAISMAAATTSVSGYLTSTDWNTFNSKQPAGTYVTSITVTSSNGLAGTVTSGATPAITLSTSITGILKGNGTAISAATSGTDYAPATSGSAILYGNGAGGFSSVTIGTGVSFAGGTLSATGSGGTVTSVTGTAPVVSSGGATPAISMAAATTSVNGYLTSTDWTTFNGKQAALVSGTNIKTVNGTTLLGSGDVGTITYAYGGTGQTTVTTGDLLYGSAANTWSKLAVGTTGQVLRVVSGAPAWGTDYVGTVTSVGGTGTVNGITLTGTVTSSGNLTLGGTLGSIANSQLSNSSITIGGTAISLGGSSNAITNDITINGLTVGKGASSVSDNTALGGSALAGITSGARNVGLGYVALQSNQTGTDNTGVGRYALNACTSSSNTAIGSASLYQATSGGQNTAVGQAAGANITTGGSNTFIGNNSSGSANNVTNEIVVCSGSGGTGKGSSTGYINANGGGVYQGNNSAAWSITSDRRLKKNIVNNDTGLDKIRAIQVRNFEYRLPEEITELEEHCAINKEGVQIGPIAQELLAVGLSECVKTESTGVMSVNTDPLVWYLVNAVKEIKAEFDAYKASHP